MADIKLTDIWGSTQSPDPITTASHPEKKLTLFALRLAVLEKSASGLGTLGFIWATVVLLGGFAITLSRTDFWFVTVILLIEGTRIFSRSHELEWQHQSTSSLTNAGIRSFRAIQSAFRLSSSRRLPSSSSIHVSSLSRKISRLLSCLQLLSASASASLSLTRLLQQDFGPVDDPGKTNRRSALNIFYSLALAEALLFLTEKAYWEWKVSYHRLLEQVNRDCDLGPSGMVSIRRFFYDAYSRCVNGSVFDGLKMDLVTFGEELLASASRDEQLIGARILIKLVSSNRFAHETLRKIGTSTPVMERLIEMLNWKNPDEEEIRRSAAEIVSKLAGKKQNALRVAGIPGAMESISSLLCRSNYRSSLLGLLIIKKLAHDHDNCGKIGHTRGLLARIIEFTGEGRREVVMETEVKAVKRSLQVVKMLASTGCSNGKTLRREISEIVYTVSNIREILQYGGKHMMLQKLGVEVLTSLAMEEDGRERIGGTGVLIRELLRIFLGREMHNSVRVEAGEALSMLALESRRNCSRILKQLGVVERLVEVLGDPILRNNCSRILQNLCTYSDDECFTQLRGVVVAIPKVLDAIMVTEMKQLEVSIGLAVQIFRLMSPEEIDENLKKASITEQSFAEKILQVLKKYDYPSINVPRIRRFTIELAICMMKTNKNYIRLFKDLEMGKELQCVVETTSELECFNVFSGSVGISRHRTTLYSLVDIALELIS